jgi:Fur family ferric uptake transcriptional regulator
MAEHARTDLRDEIRDHGARVTGARVRVLELLRAARSALSHAEVEEAARDLVVDRVTIYRVLEWLVEQGLAHRIAGPDRVWRFTAGANLSGSHAHVHCTHCGRTVCMGEIATPALRLPKGFRLDSVELKVNGLCAACGDGARGVSRTRTAGNGTKRAKRTRAPRNVAAARTARR